MKKTEKSELFSTKPMLVKWPPCTCGCCRQDNKDAEKNTIANERHDCICKHFEDYEDTLKELLSQVPRNIATRFLYTDIPEFLREIIADNFSESSDSQVTNKYEGLSNLAAPYQLEFIVALLQSTGCFFDDLSFKLAMRNLSSEEKQVILSQVIVTSNNMDELSLNATLEKLIDIQTEGKIFQLILDALNVKLIAKKGGVSDGK